MRAKTLLSLLFLAALGVVAMVFLRSVPRPTPVAAETVKVQPKYEVLVATKALASGILLRAQDVTWQPEPKLEPGEIERPSLSMRSAKPDADEDARAEVYGAALRVNLDEGAPLLLSAIAKPGDREFLHVVLTAGTRAIAIPVATGGAGTGLLNPGDRVDVILTQVFKGEDTPLTRRSVSETVVENLRVLAIDIGEGKSLALGSGSGGRTVTLEVSPEQAEKINVANELGKLSITLRSVADAPLSGPAADNGVKPTWAVDVSPALRTAVPPSSVVAAEKSAIKVMRGNKSEDTKPE